MQGEMNLKDRVLNDRELMTKCLSFLSIIVLSVVFCFINPTFLSPRNILNLLKDLQKEFSTAYLFISHDIGVIHYMSDFIVVINRGRIVEQGEGSQLIRTPKDDYTKRLIASSCSTGEGCVCGVR